jgi:hypothetical protein
MVQRPIKKILVLSGFFLAVFTGLFSQQADSLAKMIRYNPDFKFKEGVYLNFNQVRLNAPIMKSRIITSVAYDNPDFFDLVLKEKKIQLFDNIGQKQEILTKNLWGFSRNGVLYININSDYFRITIIGNICHFVASLTTYGNSGYNSYGYGYPYYSPYNSPYYSPYSSTSNVEIKQYLLDFKTGNILEYNEESVELLLMTDPELHDEFAALSKKKRKQMKFLYIRKFNEKNPLYFPEN